MKLSIKVNKMSILQKNRMIKINVCYKLVEKLSPSKSSKKTCNVVTNL